MFNSWEITAGYITNVTDNATVYIRYTQSGGGTVTQSISTYVNDNGKIAVDATNSGWDFTGSATVAIQMSKNFDSVNYASCEMMELGRCDTDEFVKSDTVISGDTITFTDAKIETHDIYELGLMDINNSRIEQTAWDSGFKPIKITVTVDGTPHEYDIVSN